MPKRTKIYIAIKSQSAGQSAGQSPTDPTVYRFLIQCQSAGQPAGQSPTDPTGYVTVQESSR